MSRCLPTGNHLAPVHLVQNNGSMPFAKTYVKKRNCLSRIWANGGRHRHRLAIDWRGSDHPESAQMISWSPSSTTQTPSSIRDAQSEAAPRRRLHWPVTIVTPQPQIWKWITTLMSNLHSVKKRLNGPPMPLCQNKSTFSYFNFYIESSFSFSI